MDPANPSPVNPARHPGSAAKAQQEGRVPVDYFEDSNSSGRLRLSAVDSLSYSQRRQPATKPCVESLPPLAPTAAGLPEGKETGEEELLAAAAVLAVFTVFPALEALAAEAAVPPVSLRTWARVRKRLGKDSWPCGCHRRRQPRSTRTTILKVIGRRGMGMGGVVLKEVRI